MHPALKYVLDPALFCAVCRQPRTQALSTTLLAGGKREEPGNEVGLSFVRYIKAACLLNYKGKFFQILSYSKVTVYSVQRIVLRWPRLSCFRVRLLRERIVRFSY